MSLRKYTVTSRCKACKEEKEHIMTDYCGPHALLLKLHRMPGTHVCAEHVVGIVQAIRLEEVFEKEDV